MMEKIQGALGATWQWQNKNRDEYTNTDPNISKKLDKIVTVR